jgi:hypothetical protein
MDLMSISRCALVAVVWLSPAAHAAERMPLAGVFIEANGSHPLGDGAGAAVGSFDGKGKLAHLRIQTRQRPDALQPGRAHPGQSERASSAERRDPAKINGSLAISYVRRTDNGVEVGLNVDDYRGEKVELDTRNGRLMIVRHVIWVV